MTGAVGGEAGGADGACGAVAEETGAGGVIGGGAIGGGVIGGADGGVP